MPDVVGTGVIRVEVDSAGVDADVARVVDQANTTLQAKSKTSGDAAGKNFGDAYGKALKTKLGDAIKALPGVNDIKFGINTDEATQRILAVKGDLLALSNQRIGIDISDADAQAKLALIKAELKDLSSSSNTQIRVDASQASAALAELDKELLNVSDDSKKATGTKGSDSGGGISGLIVAIAGVAPAAIPLGAVAGAALGTVALTAGAAALAIKGVSAEMKAGTDLGIAYTKGVGQIQADLSQLEKTAAGGLFGPFETGIADIQKLMPDLNKEVGDFANIGGQIADHVLVGIIGGFKVMQPLINEIGVDFLNGAKDFDQWTQNGGLQKFSQYAEQELPQVIATVKELGQAAITLVEDLAPFGGASLSAIKLLSEAINALPVDQARILIDVLGAGLVIYKGYQIVSTLGDWYTKATKAVIAYTTAQKALNAANIDQAASASRAGAADSLQAVAESGDAAAAATETVAVDAEAAANALQGTSAAADATTTSIKGVASAAGGAGGGGAALEGLSGALAGIGVAGGVAIAAVLGVTLIAAAGAVTLTHYTDAATEQDLKFKELATDTSNYTAALEASNGVVDNNTRLVAAQALQSNGLADKAGKAGISLTQLTAGVTGNNDQFKSLIDTWKASGNPSQQTIIQLEQQHQAFENGSISAAKFAAAVAASIPPQQAFSLSAKTTAASITDINNAYGLTATQASQYVALVGLSAAKIASGTISNQQYSLSLAAVTTALDTGDMATSKYFAALQTFSTSADTASDQAALLGAILVKGNGDLLGYEGAVAGGYAAVYTLTDAFKAEATAVKGGTEAFSDSEKGAITYQQTANGLTADINLQARGAGALITQLQGLQTGAESAAEATYQHELATKGSSAAAADAETVFQNLTSGALTANAKQLGLTTAQAQALSNTYFQFDGKTVTTDVQAIGLNDINSTLDALGQQLSYISGRPWNVTVAFESIGGAALHAAVNDLNNADGNIVDFYANGGMRENHTAHIAKVRAGTVRVFAEPETGGEAYIPLSPSKRARSTAIWQETGKRLGATSYADGGVVGAASNGSLLSEVVSALYAISERPVILQAKNTQIAKVVNEGNLVLNRRN